MLSLRDQSAYLMNGIGYHQPRYQILRNSKLPTKRLLSFMKQSSTSWQRGIVWPQIVLRNLKEFGVESEGGVLQSWTIREGSSTEGVAS